MNQIAFVINQKKLGAEVLAKELAKIAMQREITVKMTSEYPLPPKFLKDQDLCCVIGGDGTFLSTVKESITWQVPVFGINHGKLGFLATTSVQESHEHFAKVLDGEYDITHRSVLECRIREDSSFFALNDAVIKNASPSQLINLAVYSNGKFIADYRGDGLIFSTPTGSTAYNLSAGGPIIHPSAKVIAMTPICPHTLSNRSFIFPEQIELRVVNTEPSVGVRLTLDGQEVGTSSGEIIFPLTIRLYEKPLLFLQPSGYSHFRVLRSKLSWEGKNTSSDSVKR